MIKVDYHTHNSRCGHAQGTIEEYVKTAVSRGLTDIGVSDHSPVYWLDGNDPMPVQAMAKDELPIYVDEVLSLKERYAGTPVTVERALYWSNTPDATGPGAGGCRKNPCTR